MQLFDKSGNSIISIDVSKCFASGGEGSICEHPVDKKLVVKIYHKPRDLKLEQSLIELKKLSSKFIKPTEIFYNKKGEISGFSMQYVDLNQYHILKKIFNNTFCLQHGFDRKIKFKIWENLKIAVEDAHSNDIYIGDLNPYNILVDVKGEVILLDVDSFGTKSKPHNGVLLEDIRDWLYHPRVDKETDKYAFDVLTFWMFTFLHPFRGDYPQHKTLEERVTKKSSVLSGLNIVLPKCYQPFQNNEIISQFKEVFQDGKRFLIDLSGQPSIIQAAPISTPVLVSSIDLFIRIVMDQADGMVCSETQMAILKNGTWYVYSIKDFGIFNQMYTISDSDDVFVGNENIVYQKQNFLWNEGKKFSNVDNLHGIVISGERNSIFLTNSNLDKYEILDVDRIMNSSILKNQNSIYVKSLNFGDSGVWQNIGDKKWILDFNSINFNIIKTEFNIKNIYKRRNYVLIEHLDKNKTRYTICKISGLKIEIGCDIPEWKYFDVKQDYIFIPEDGKINIINPSNNWKIVSEINCPVCSFDSKIFHSNAGMIIQTGGSIYLINKK